MGRVYDAFIFYNELDILEIRLHKLYPVVDRFIIVEGSKTYTGGDKVPNFAVNMQRYRRFWDKIEYVYVDDWPESEDPWERERHQRNALFRKNGSLSDDDFIILSDVDEIPSREAVARLRSAPANFYAFQQELSYFKFDYIHTSLLLHQKCCSIAIRKKAIGGLSGEQCRASRIEKVRGIETGLSSTQAGINVFESAGWHASYLGDVDFVRNKIKNFSHQELNNEDFLRGIDIEKIINSEGDLFGRPDESWQIASRPIPVPHLIKEDLTRFGHMMIDEKNILYEDSLWFRYLARALSRWRQPTARSSLVRRA